MNFKYSFLIIALFLFVVSCAQPTKWKNNKYCTTVSYNVENLFDTINEPNKNDNEFVPDSERAYNSERYYKKLDRIAEVISSINSNELPELVGLTEVENARVLKDLIETDALKQAKYKFVHEESPDVRGIDCALLYRPDVFSYLNHKSIEVLFDFNKKLKTRDILYVTGMIHKDTVHVFVNHWSSRRGGREKSEPKRIQAATTLNNYVDSILNINLNSRILIMGDFNDTPENKSLDSVLNAGKPTENKKLINLMYELHEQGKGTYYYADNFDMLDNLIISTELKNAKTGFRLYEVHGYIFSPEFICFTRKNGAKTPNKTYVGNKYYGGYSDHFPIYTIFYEK